MRTDGTVGTIKGVNVGLDGEPPNGILNVTCQIGGKTVDCHRVNGYDETEEIAIPDVKVGIG